MKKTRLLLLLAAFLFGYSCTKDLPMAEQDETPSVVTHSISPECALVDLNSLLAEIDGGNTRSGNVRAVSSINAVKTTDLCAATRSGKTPDIENLVYIANFEQNEGYAILGADDRVPSVIVITDQGNLTMQELVDTANGKYADAETAPLRPETAAYIAGLGTGGIGGGIGGGGWTPPYTDIDFGGQPRPGIEIKRYGEWITTGGISPLLLTRWGQDAPFNKYTPTVYNMHCPTGCVAVALAQIIATNQYKLAYDSPLYKKYCGGYLIDWRVIYPAMSIDNAVISYDPSTAAIDMIAKLMAGIGQMVDMNYTLTESGAFDTAAARFLTEFGYALVQTSPFYNSIVDKMVCEKHLPVYVSGYDAGAGKGHAWIIDGKIHQYRNVDYVIGLTGVVTSSYTEGRDLYHCNYGYNGPYDGYYYPASFYNNKYGQAYVDKELNESEDRRDRSYEQQLTAITYTIY